MKPQGMGRRLVLFPLPLQGHQTPMLQLANILYSNGFSISIIHTHFNSPNPANYPHFTFHPIPELLEGKARTGDVIALLNTFNVSCEVPFRDFLSQMMSESAAAAEPVACLITDAIWHFTQAVADSLQLPRIVLRTSNPTSFLSFISISLLREKGYLSAKEAQKEDPVLEIPPLKVKDLPPEAHHEALVAHAKEIKDCPDGIICNTFEELEGSVLDRVHQNFPSIPVFLVGPLHKYSTNMASNEATEGRGYLTWLNKQAADSVLYVSFGTLAVISEEQFLEVAWGLAKSEQPFLWVVRPKLFNDSDKSYTFPEEFLKAVGGRGLIVPWALQNQVLANPAVGGFWTHCGWNSTLESISEGVPMICFPFWADQMPNARQLTDVLKIGLQLEKGLERQEIAQMIRRLMVEKEGEEMRKRAAALKEKAQQCMEEGGSSYESLNRLTSHILSLAKLKE